MSITVMPVPCANEDHRRPVAAVARLCWPTGRFRPVTACLGDLFRQVRQSLDEGVPVEVWPANREPDSALGFGRWRRAPDCARCGDTGRFEETACRVDQDGAHWPSMVNAHCTCKRGRRMSELWYADKHGHYHPDAFEPSEPPDPEGPPF
jgi:hypothetical protein